MECSLQSSQCILNATVNPSQEGSGIPSTLVPGAGLSLTLALVEWGRAAELLLLL